MGMWLGSSYMDIMRWHSLIFEPCSEGKADDIDSSIFRKVFETLKASFKTQFHPVSTFSKVRYPEHASIYCLVLLQGVRSSCCARLKKRWQCGTIELPQRSVLDCNYFMFAFVFRHHQVRGVGGVHSVVVLKYNWAECLMKCGVVAEEKIKQMKHAESDL